MAGAGVGPKPESATVRPEKERAGAGKDLRGLAQAASCSETHLDLLSIALTHETALEGAPYEVEAARSLHEHLTGIGGQAIAASAVHHLLNDQRLADVSHVEKRLQALRKGLYAAIASRFDLMSLARIGRSLRESAEAEGTVPERFIGPPPAVPSHCHRSEVESIILKRFIGAVYLASSYENVKGIVGGGIAECERAAAASIFDAKSLLQEVVQRRCRSGPVYTVLDVSGPEHNCVFTCRVVVGKQLADGTGPTRKAAEQGAARKFLESLPPQAKPPDVSKSYLVLPPEHYETRSMRSDSLRPLPAAVREAQRLAPKIGFDRIDHVQLAVALTLPSKRFSQFDSNVRHAFLGEKLEKLAFRIFAQQAIPAHITCWAPVNLFEYRLCNVSSRARLFQALGCHPVSELSPPFPATSEAAVVNAIAAAVYLSCNRFSDFFRWAVDILGDRVQVRIMDLCGNPARLKDPKSLLQELSQGSLAFAVDYATTTRGPAHEAVFTTAAHAIDERGQRTVLGMGTAASKRESEFLAAANAAKVLTPTRSGAPLSRLAVAVWRRVLEAALEGDGRVFTVCGIDCFRTLNSFDAYFELKAFAASLPSLADTLMRPEFVRAMLRSVGHLSPFAIKDVHGLAMKGIDLVTRVPPSECHRLCAADLHQWLESFRRAANSLKLPSRPIERPGTLPRISELVAPLRLEKVSLSLVRHVELSEAHFSHIATLLERVDDYAEAECQATISGESLTESARCAVAFAPGSVRRFQTAQVINALVPHAFFSGVLDSSSETGGVVVLDTKGVIPDPHASYSAAYAAIMQALFQQQQHLQTLYRVVHDLKNRILAIRELAGAAETDALTRYQSLAAVERLQQQVRELRVSLATYFAALESDTTKTCNLLQLFRAFVQRELSSLPANIQIKIDATIDPSFIEADPELIQSLLANLSRNAIEAMTAGGVLSVSAVYSTADRIFFLEIGDTGCGIPESRLPDVLSGMHSTKRGMGLGLATAKRIVELYNGTIEIKSVPHKGTSVLIALALRPAVN